MVGGVQPCVTFVNVELCGDLAAGEGRTGSQATVLLENPAGQNALSGDHLVEQVGVRWCCWKTRPARMLCRDSFGA